MDRKQIMIFLKIGSMNVSNLCIDSVSVDRNFSDVGDKFSITLIDAPNTNVLYDLELYMASGYRDIVLKYGDISENKLVAFTGTIWDYTNTFVGNIKKLTVTGIASRYTKNEDGPASWTYNINWNSYFNMREDEEKNYDAINALLIRNTISSEYYDLTKNNPEDSVIFRASDILNAQFRSALVDNTKYLTDIKGPGGTIQLPMPDSFYSISGSQIPTDISAWLDNPNEKDYPDFYKFMFDPGRNHWGELTIKRSTSEEGTALIHNLSPYLADYFYVYNKSVDGRSAYDKSGYSTSKNCITNVTSNLLSSLYGMRFTQNVNGIKMLSNCYIHAFNVENFYKSLTGKLKNWYEYTEYESFYGKIVMVGGQPQYDYVQLDDENGGNWVGICRNSAGAVVAFYFKRGNSRYGPFVAVENTYTNDYSSLMLKIVPTPSITDNSLSYVDKYKYDSAKLKKYTDDKTGNLYFYEKARPEILRGFLFPDASGSSYSMYLQANVMAKNNLFGSAGLLASGIGVDISDIVKKLATLEGWKFRDSDIVQTELVANSDSFIMQNQTAMDFIVNNLVPRSITPIGMYTDVNGDEVPLTTPQAGFYPFFDSDGYFHYQPLTKESVKTLNIPNLGYNIPDSPTISFQVNTKGTAFYTYNNIEYNPLNIVTGNTTESNTTVDVISESQAEELAKNKYHNDTFDDWLGLTYNDVESMVASEGNNVFFVRRKMFKSARNALVNSPSTLLMGTAAEGTADIVTKLGAAKKKIEESVIKATMSMWGNVEVAPACNIKVTNMLKGGVSGGGQQYNYPVKHPSSGQYLILSMQDKIDSGGFIQNLNLLRYSDDVSKNINSYKIDYSKKASYALKVTERKSASRAKEAVDAFPTNLPS